MGPWRSSESGQTRQDSEKLGRFRRRFRELKVAHNRALSQRHLSSSPPSAAYHAEIPFPAAQTVVRFEHAYTMTFDFETPHPRLGTDSQKWQKYAGRDILPLWVADMDFKSSPSILAALHARVDEGVFGYARPVKSTVDAVVDACARN